MKRKIWTFDFSHSYSTGENPKGVQIPQPPDIQGIDLMSMPFLYFKKFCLGQINKLLEGIGVQQERSKRWN